VLASKLLVLIDGRSVYTPLFAGVYWNVQDTPLEDVERIEVIRGPGGTIWGANAVDGVINIITKNSKDTHGALITAGGGNVDQGTFGFRYGGGNGKDFSYRIYGKGFSTGPEFHPNGLNFDDWRSAQAGFRTDWNRGDRDSFTLQGDIYQEDAGEGTTFGLYSPPTQVTAYANAELAGGNLLGHWKRVLSEGSDVQVQTYYDRTNHFEPEFGESRDTFDIDFLHHLTLLGQQSFLWGVGARLSPAHFAQLVPTIDFLPHHQTDHIYSAFAQDEIPFFNHRVSLTMGSKLEHNNYTGFEVQPNARLLWAPNTRQSYWVSVSRAVRTPSRLEENIQLTDFATVVPLPVYLRVVGNGNFFSEVLYGYEAGYRTLVTPHFSIDLALFHNNYNYLSSFQVGSFFLETAPLPVHAVLPLLTTNGIKGTTNGIEVAPDWRPTRWWELKGSYSYLSMDLQKRTGSNDPTSVLKVEGSSPRNQLAIESLVNLPKRFELDTTYRQVSALPAQSSSNVLPASTVKGYETADARLGWHLNSQLELSIVGQNLLQSHHAEFGGDPGPLVLIRRSAYVKLTWQTAR